MIIVTSTAKDAATYAPACVASVAAQTGVQFEHWYTAADTETASAIARSASPASRLRLRVCPDGALVNLLRMWRDAAPEDIIVHLDGDDTLHGGALEYVQRAHAAANVWLTYGRFRLDDGRLDSEWHPYFGHRYGGQPRHEPWRASHLKTFRAGLVQAIPDSYLRRADGTYYTTCLDRCVMLAALELAGERYAVASRTLVTYNLGHARTPDALEDSDRMHIHTRAPLRPLEQRPW